MLNFGEIELSQTSLMVKNVRSMDGEVIKPFYPSSGMYYLNVLLCKN